jgi:hypothetical protein
MMVHYYRDKKVVSVFVRFFVRRFNLWKENERKEHQFNITEITYAESSKRDSAIPRANH